MDVQDSQDIYFGPATLATKRAKTLFIRYHHVAELAAAEPAAMLAQGSIVHDVGDAGGD